MHVPVELRARVEPRVDGRKKVAAEGGRHVFIRDVVERIGEGYFVEVQRQRAQVEGVCHRLHIFDKILGALEGEWVVHRGGGAARSWSPLLSLGEGCGEWSGVVWGAWSSGAKWVGTVVEDKEHPRSQETGAGGTKTSQRRGD